MKHSIVLNKKLLILSGIALSLSVFSCAENKEDKQNSNEKNETSEQVQEPALSPEEVTDSLKACISMAKEYTMVGHWDKAQAVLDAGLALDPDNEDLLGIQEAKNLHVQNQKAEND